MYSLHSDNIFKWGESKPKSDVNGSHDSSEPLVGVVHLIRGRKCTSERIILLDTQHVYSLSILADMIRPDGSSTISVLGGGESLPAELAHELMSIQLGVLLTSICHIVLLVSEGVHDNNMWRLMETNVIDGAFKKKLLRDTSYRGPKQAGVVDIFSQLQNPSEAFQTYVRDVLAQMEKNATAGRMPSSVPMPKLPPSALNLPSPKFTHLSPVHTNSLNNGKYVNTKSVPMNFSPPPPSYAEDERSSRQEKNHISAVSKRKLKALEEQIDKQLKQFQAESSRVSSPTLPKDTAKLLIPKSTPPLELTTLS
ncbi:SMG9-like protein [Tanacetum coccineum]